MSMIYWGILMYGVCDNDLPAGDKDFCDIQEEIAQGKNCLVELDNGKKIQLYMEIAEDAGYFGYPAGYPWQFRNMGDSDVTEEDVQEAIAKFLDQYGYDRDAVIKACEEISSYNYG